jgi:hypothetical protein
MSDDGAAPDGPGPRPAPAPDRAEAAAPDRAEAATPDRAEAATPDRAEAATPDRAEAATQAGPSDPDGGERRRARLELVAVIVLSTVTILTAWSAFQSSKWGGAMSIAFSQASSQRIQAASLAGTANVRTSNQIGLWTEWVAAVGQGDEPLADFLLERFPEPLATAHDAWVDAGGVDAGPSAESPFAMPEFVMPESVAAAAASARADERFETALRNNQRGDNYTVLTVLFAAVLFFTAMSTRVRAVRSQQLLLGVGMAVGLVGLALLVAYPKLV